MQVHAAWQSRIGHRTMMRRVRWIHGRLNAAQVYKGIDAGILKRVQDLPQFDILADAGRAPNAAGSSSKARILSTIRRCCSHDRERESSA